MAVILVFGSVMLFACGPDSDDSAGKVDSDSVRRAEIQQQKKNDSLMRTNENKDSANDTVSVDPIDSVTMMKTINVLDSIMATKKK